VKLRAVRGAKRHQLGVGRRRLSRGWRRCVRAAGGPRDHDDGPDGETCARHHLITGDHGACSDVSGKQAMAVLPPPSGSASVKLLHVSPAAQLVCSQFL